MGLSRSLLTDILSHAPERNLAMQPALEALRSETQQLYDRAIAAEAEWPKQEAELKEAYKVRQRGSASGRRRINMTMTLIFADAFNVGTLYRGLHLQLCMPK